jgi:transcriptional regulator with XRE-family HTH domain
MPALAVARPRRGARAMMGPMSAARPPADEPAGAGWSAQINALGGFIRAQRQLANLSLREMASMTSVSNAYLSQVERGLHQPSLKVLHSIADALQLSTEQMLKQAGWESGAEVPSAPEPAGSTEDAIRADPRLSPEQRTALLGVYRSFVEGDQGHSKLA